MTPAAQAEQPFGLGPHVSAVAGDDVPAYEQLAEFLQLAAVFGGIQHRRHSAIKIEGFPEAASRRNRRRGWTVRSVSPGPERTPSGWVRCIRLFSPVSPMPRTCSGVSTTTAISSWSSPPGNP